MTFPHVCSETGLGSDSHNEKQAQKASSGLHGDSTSCTIPNNIKPNKEISLSGFQINTASGPGGYG